jgi:hypothetical protein
LEEVVLVEEIPAEEVILVEEIPAAKIEEPLLPILTQLIPIERCNLEVITKI